MFTEHPTSGKLLLMLTSSYDSQLFLDSFSAERPDFQGYSSDFEESVVSQDYWKLVEKDGKLILEEDGQNDVVDENGNILASHNQELLDKINRLEELHAEGLNVGIGELEKLKAQYKASNERMTAGYGGIDLLSKTLAGAQGGNANSTAIRRAMYQKFIDDGFSIGEETNWKVMDGKKNTMDGANLDITDLFMQSEGLDRKSILGDSSMISDDLFSTLLGDTIRLSMTDGIHDLGTIPEVSDAVSRIEIYKSSPYSGSKSVKELEEKFGETSMKNSATKSFQDKLLFDDGSDYDQRAKNLADTMIDQVVDSAYDYYSGFSPTNYAQRPVSEELKWGYLELLAPVKNLADLPIPHRADGTLYNNPISSLCFGMTLLAIHDAENLVSTTGNEKIEFYKDAYEKGEILANGTVQDYTFGTQYTKYAGGVAPSGYLWEQNALNSFSAFEASGHKVMYESNSLLVEPWGGLDDRDYIFYRALNYQQRNQYNWWE